MRGVAAGAEHVALGDLGQEPRFAPAHHVRDGGGLAPWVPVMEVQAPRVVPVAAAHAPAGELEGSNERPAFGTLSGLALAPAATAVAAGIPQGILAMVVDAVLKSVGHDSSVRTVSIEEGHSVSLGAS